jgi:hypothetical protein
MSDQNEPLTDDELRALMMPRFFEAVAHGRCGTKHQPSEPCPAGPAPVPPQCQHDDWDRSVAEWVRCTENATTKVNDFGRVLWVCDEDARLY